MYAMYGNRSKTLFLMHLKRSFKSIATKKKRILFQLGFAKQNLEKKEFFFFVSTLFLMHYPLWG